MESSQTYADAFKKAEEDYRGIVAPGVERQRPDYFSSTEFTELRSLAEAVFRHASAATEQFLKVVRGLSRGTDVGVPGVEEALSLPNRVFGQSSTAAFHPTLARTLDQMIASTFYLGLITHLFLQTFPSRKDVQRVDTALLLRQFAPRAIVADRQLAAYDRANGGLPRSIFDAYNARVIRPLLQTHFRLGFWKMGKADSHFRNLFFAGVLFGMQMDMSTSA